MGEKLTVFSESDITEAFAHSNGIKTVKEMITTASDPDEQKTLRIELWERRYNMWKFFNKKFAHVTNLTQLLDFVWRISWALGKRPLNIVCTDFDTLLSRVRRFITCRRHTASKKAAKLSAA